jgi:hypothetical protein
LKTWFGADSSLLFNKFGVKSSSPLLNRSKYKEYCEEFVVLTGVCEIGKAVELPVKRTAESFVAQFNDILVNICSCSPETEELKLFAKFVVKLLLCESKFLFVFPNAKLLTKRTFLSLVSNEVPGDFKSLNLGESS